jgi:hypothetical protein
MRRTNGHGYALAAPGTGSRASDSLTTPTSERWSRSPIHSAEEHEADDSPSVWSLWIDVGGEG